MVRCGTCARENRDGARFCDGCGSSLVAVPVDPARKVVTVLFADLVGSTSAQEGVDPEAVRRWIDRYNTVLRRVIEDHGGRVAKFTGDGVMAVFGIPDVREDDARRAVEAGAALHAAVEGLAGGAGDPAQVALRVGVNTGEVVVSPGTDDVVGDVVNVAARLQTAAGAGEVFVGEPTFRLVRAGAQLRPLPPLELKGKAAPVTAFQLISLVHEDDGPSSPFVGRAGELERLIAVLDDAVATRRACLASIVGSPGVGKTRLAHELTARVGHRARVLEVRCEAAGGSTFGPIAAALRQAAGLDEDAGAAAVVSGLSSILAAQDADRDRIAAVVGALLGVGEPGRPEETFWAIRRLIEDAAQHGPLVFVFDDVHSAEPLLLDLIENVADWTRDAPVMLLLTARPELRDLRPNLVEAGGRVQVAIGLEGLEVDESHRLARALVGGAELPGALLDRVAQASEGNPLFVGELVRMLVDDGALELVEGRGRMTIDLAELDVPVSIHALLGARLDRLAADERSILEAASVIGKTFYRGAVAALVAPPLAARLDEVLDGLRRKELVEPAGTLWLDEPVLRFHHVLIRDAAYRRLLKEARAPLHQAAARWFETMVGGLTEHDDVIGYQLERAHLLREEMGDPDPALGAAAAARLAAAGRRALDAGDQAAAAALLGRAVACLPAEDPTRGELLLDQCEALLAIGDVTDAAGAVHELEAAAAGSPRLEAWVACFAGQLANLRDAGALADTVVRAAEAAAQLAELGDAAGEAKAQAVRAASLGRLGRIAECETVMDSALAAARRAGDRRRATTILSGAPVVALWGPNPVTRASGRCLDVVRVLRLTTEAPAVEATALWCQAVLEALRGRDHVARRMLGSARRALEELGHEHGLLELDLAAGMVAMLDDRPRDAELFLRRAHDGFHARGADVDAGLAAALLARIYLDAGQLDEALELTVESEKLGGDDLKTGIAWRAVRAEAMARRGELEPARLLAAEAVARAAPTDAVLDHADALMAWAEVARTVGIEPRADAAARMALELYERKEATVPAGRARRFLDVDGRLVANEVFDADDVTIAPEELDRRGGTGASPAQDGALENAATRFCARWVPTLLAADWDGLRAMFTDDIEGVDYRPLVGDAQHMVGADAVLEGNKGVLAVGVTSLDLEPLELGGDRAVLLRAAYRGPAGGLTVLQLIQVSEGGRLRRSEVFDLNQLDEAMDRLRQLAAEEAVPDNLAVRVIREGFRRMLVGDATTRELLHPDAVAVDHRVLVGGLEVVGRDAFNDNLRGIYAIGVRHATIDVLAIHGHRLCLLRTYLSSDDPAQGGQGTVDAVQVNVVGDDGLVVRSEVFDATDLVAARARFDALVAELDETPG